MVRTGRVPVVTPQHVTTGHFLDESDTDTVTVNLDAGKTYRAILELHFSATHAVYESIVSDGHSPLPASQGMVGPRRAEFTFTATHSEEYRFTISAQTLVLRGSRLRWVGGAYTFRVGELANIQERPSKDCAADEGTYCSLIPNTTDQGGIDPSGDVDWVALPGLEAGRLYEFEVTAGYSSDDLTNVQVRFHNQYTLSVTRPRGISTAISYRPGYSGTHYLQISSSAMGDSSTGPYRIAMTEVVSLDQRHETPLTETTDCPAATPTCTFTVGDTVDGALDPANDIDSWQVDLEAGKTYQFDVEGRNGGDGALSDPTIILYDTGNTEVGSSSTQFTHAVQTGEGGTYTLDVESDGGNTGGYRITATDITPSGQQDLREEAPQPATPLTAAFGKVPAEHDGSSAFDLELHFSEAPKGLSYRTLSGNSFFNVTNGTVTKAKRLKKKDNSGWRITVEPASDADVTIGLLPALPTADCAEAAVVCTADGTRLSVGPATFVPGPASLSVADASVQEGPNAALDFVVTLSRARHEATTVDYATSDGTATAGSDYTADSGTLSFAIGETEKTVSVAVLDDAHDEGRRR